MRSRCIFISLNLSKHVPIAFGMITICQNTFPSLLPLFCNGNVFWQIENTGNIGKKALKTQSHRQNCTKKALTSLKAMPKAWKMVPQRAIPLGEENMEENNRGKTAFNWKFSSREFPYDHTYYLVLTLVPSFKSYQYRTLDTPDEINEICQCDVVSSSHTSFTYQFISLFGQTWQWTLNVIRFKSKLIFTIVLIHEWGGR